MYSLQWATWGLPEKGLFSCFQIRMGGKIWHFSVMGYRDGEPWLVASKPSALVYLHARFNWLHVYGVVWGWMGQRDIP